MTAGNDKRSPWNQWTERLLEADLTREELRLGVAFAREIIGWKRTSARLGRDLLRARSGLHGRSFERARDGLEAKGLLHVEQAEGKLTYRPLYTLLLDTESAAQERQILNAKSAAKSAAQERPRTTSLRDEKGTNAATPHGASFVVDDCLGDCGTKHPLAQLDQHNGYCESCTPQRVNVDTRGAA